MKNEKLAGLARGLSAWRAYRKAMLEMQKQQMDSSSTTDKHGGVQSVDSDRRVLGKGVRGLPIYDDRSKK